VLNLLLGNGSNINDMKRILEQKVGEICIPAFEIDKGEYCRLQCENIEEYNAISVCNLDSDILNLNLWGKESNDEEIFSHYSVEEYICNYLDTSEAEYFLMDLIDISRDQRIDSLPESYKTIIYSKIVSYLEIKTIFIGTGGMHLYNLRQVYGILNRFLEKGGSCIEYTYPPVDDMELNSILKTDIKIIKL